MSKLTKKPFHRSAAFWGVVVAAAGVIVAFLAWQHPWQPADFDISIAPMQGTVQQGGVTTMVVTLKGINGYNHAVNINAVGQPQDVVSTFVPPMGGPIPSYTSTTTISAGRGAPVGTYELVIRGLGANGKEHSVKYLLTITTGNTDFQVTIDAPREGEALPLGIDIKGTLQGKPQQGRFLWVVIHPHNCPGQWWPQGGRLDAIEGPWSIPATLGKKEEPGTKFDIAVISVDRQDDRAYTDYLEKSAKRRSFPGISLPQSAEFIKKITVQRNGGRPYAPVGGITQPESTRIDNRNPTDYLQPWQIRERGRR